MALSEEKHFPYLRGPIPGIARCEFVEVYPGSQAIAVKLQLMQARITVPSEQGSHLLTRGIVYFERDEASFSKLIRNGC